MHTAKVLSGFLAAHGIEVSSYAEVTELDDATIDLTRKLFIQICDYPIREGGLVYILNRYIFKNGMVDGCDELAVFNDRFELLKKILVELA